MNGIPKYLFPIILIANISFFCADKPPEVKVNNQGNSTLDVFFTIVDCSCPSISFLSVSPKSETPYRECSTTKYSISLKILDYEVGPEFFLAPEVNKKYQLIIDSNYNCRINIFDR